VEASVSACSSSSGGKSRADAGASRDAGAHHIGTVVDSGGSGPSTTCQSTTLAVAPTECLDEDWAHAQATYSRRCETTLGAYQATCASFDTIIVEAPATETWCFYSQKTGTLTASLQKTASRSTCLTFDFGFALPDTSACTPKSGAECTDAGAP
jgi:hypothetical protein